jgi:hypothetical protein
MSVILQVRRDFPNRFLIAIYCNVAAQEQRSGRVLDQAGVWEWYLGGGNTNAPYIVVAVGRERISYGNTYL